MKYKNWNRTLWQQEIELLPEGMTAVSIAKRLKKNYSITLLWLNKFRYGFPDQRGVASARIQRKLRKVDLANVDWSLSHAENGRKYGVSRERMRQISNAVGKPRT